MKILSIVGARPNFMKVAPLHRAFLARPSIISKIVHTGQHYDAKMSEVFFEQLELPKPDYYLGVGGGSHTQQTAKIMLAFEPILEAEQPDLVLVVGDVNSTVACTLVATKMNIPVAHVEAGLRSGDRKMPEELNRLMTDAVSDFLFVTEQSGLDHLMHEGVPPVRVFFVGNCMIDSLVYYRRKAAQLASIDLLGLTSKAYVLVTMHRPSNVDTAEGLTAIVEMIELVALHTTVVFPVHPRTRNNFEKFGLQQRLAAISSLRLLEPQGYLEFLQLMEHATVVLTDSGGIQEETTYLQVPCLTFRDSTERPITVDIGSNILLHELNPLLAYAALIPALEGRWKKSVVPPLWDGRAAERIAHILLEHFMPATKRLAIQPSDKNSPFPSL